MKSYWGKNKISVMKRRACKVRLEDYDLVGIVFRLIEIDGYAYVFGNFGGKYLLVDKGIVKLEEGLFEELGDIEVW